MRKLKISIIYNTYTQQYKTEILQHQLSDLLKGKLTTHNWSNISTQSAVGTVAPTPEGT